jgi:hypothetical protein
MGLRRTPSEAQRQRKRIDKIALPLQRSSRANPARGFQRRGGRKGQKRFGRILGPLQRWLGATSTPGRSVPKGEAKKRVAARSSRKPCSASHVDAEFTVSAFLSLLLAAPHPRSETREHAVCEGPFTGFISHQRGWGEREKMRKGFEKGGN